jgi:hypothetical protein
MLPAFVMLLQQPEAAFVTCNHAAASLLCCFICFRSSRSFLDLFTAGCWLGVWYHLSCLMCKGWADRGCGCCLVARRTVLAEQWLVPWQRCCESVADHDSSSIWQPSSPMSYSATHTVFVSVCTVFRFVLAFVLECWQPRACVSSGVSCARACVLYVVATHAANRDMLVHCRLAYDGAFRLIAITVTKAILPCRTPCPMVAPLVSAWYAQGHGQRMSRLFLSHHFH